MKIYEIKSLSSEELKNRLREENEGLENLRFQKSMGQLENFKSIKNTKKLIARIHTVLKEREASEKETSEKEVSEKVGKQI
ncbi:MAG: 50S ribosomal protein L29 [Chlorobi bacterium]|nr:50S ribosomal protein L29 [Chlorobiota bacterium]MCI0714911.1 50S ribosomal protein L29 [Chlorobiota bacterium]